MTDIIKLKCTVLPTMNRLTLIVNSTDTIRDLDMSIINKSRIYPKYIIFRGDIMRDYTTRICDLKLCKNDEIFIVKKEFSNSLLTRTSSRSSQTNSLIQSLIRATTTESEDVSVSVELTNGDTTIVYDEETPPVITDLLNQFIAPPEDDRMDELITPEGHIPAEMYDTLAHAPYNGGLITEAEDEVGDSVVALMDETSEPVIQEVYEYQSQLEQILEMGYVDEIYIREVLSVTEGNVTSALVYL